MPNGKHVPVILLANKADVCQITDLNEIDKFCEKNQILAKFLTSAKENLNIGKLIFIIYTLVYLLLITW